MIDSIDFNINSLLTPHRIIQMEKIRYDIR